MAEAEALFGAGIFLVLGIFFARLGLPTLWTGLQAARASGTAPGDVRPGPAVVTGAPEALEEPVEAPYTGTECIAFDADVERYNEERGSNWRHAYGMADGAAFELRDAGGTVTVDPDRAEFFLGRTFQEVSERGEPAPGAAEGDAESPGRSALYGSGSPGEMRYTEYRLDPDDDAWVLGVAAAESGPGSTLTISDSDRRSGITGKLRDPPLVVADGGGSPFWHHVLWKGFVPILAGLGSIAMAGYLYVAV